MMTEREEGFVERPTLTMHIPKKRGIPRLWLLLGGAIMLIGLVFMVVAVTGGLG